MKIALLGYGKMGKMIEGIALERKHEVVAKLDASPESIADLNGADVAIEFTMPEAAVRNIKFCLENAVPIVVGTTGWYDKFEEVSKEVSASNGALFHATNFSLGVNILFHMNRQLARIMGKQNQYKVSVEEIHHTQKLDAPSGTAISIAQQIISESGRWKSWELAVKENNNPEVIPVIAERRDPAPGTHRVTYSSEVDEIQLYHNAFNRKGFAEGAVLAAEWLPGKKGIFTMEDLLKF